MSCSPNLTPPVTSLPPHPTYVHPSNLAKLVLPVLTPPDLNARLLGGGQQLRTRTRDRLRKPRRRLIDRGDPKLRKGTLRAAEEGDDGGPHFGGVERFFVVCRFDHPIWEL